MWKVQLFELNYDDREPAAVRRVLQGGWITMGLETAAFEEEFSSLLGGAACTAVSSGTAALHTALLALDIKPGDEVIVPALTFVAVANAVRMLGATPVLADSASAEDWNVGADQIHACITGRTKAVTCVHFAGFACDMPAIAELCSDLEIPLIEDAAHAPGASSEGRPLGTWGDLGCFSFFTNKNLSVGEGGMISTRNETLHQAVRAIRSHGMSTLTLDRHEGRATSYDVTRPGLNYRMDEMRAAIGRVQLEKLQGANEARRHLTLLYRERLGSDRRVCLPFLEHELASSSCHLLPVLLPPELDRNAIMAGLRRRGIQSSIHYPRLAQFSGYAALGLSACPVAEAVSDRELTLPLFPTMGEAKVDYVCAALKEALDEVGA